MNYTFVNHNYLIPIILKYDNKDEAINKLQNETVFRTSSEFNKNVYLVEEKNNTSILYYYSDGKSIYVKNLMLNDKPIVYHNYKTFNIREFEYIQEYSSVITQNNTISNETNKEMNLSFNTPPPTNNIIIGGGETKNVSFKLDFNTNEFEANEIKSNEFEGNELKSKISTSVKLSNQQDNINLKPQEKTELENSQEVDESKMKIIQMIEEVNELYQKELSNMKRLEMNIKSYDLKLNKLEKKKRDDIINDIIRTQSEYRTWKKIKYGIKEDIDEMNVMKPVEELEESNDKVPILFQSKYDYLEKIQTNETIKKLLYDINQIDLNQLFSNDNLPDDKIVQFCNKYMKLSKELHYTFDHEWDYLENEMNLNSTNRLSVQK